MKYLITILIALSFLSGSAQESDIEIQQVLRNDGHDTSYIKDFHSSLVLKTYVVNKSNNFSVTDINEDITTEFKPNDGANLGFGVNYKSFGVSVAFIPLGKKDEDKYGKTRKVDLQANVNTRKFGIDLRFQYYNGFYIENANSIDPNFPVEDVPVRSDISTLSFGGNIFYIFNSDQYSFRNTFTNNEWQKKSSGSFFAGSSFSMNRISADSIIAPTEVIDSLENSNYLKKIQVFSLGGFGGYAYTYVFAKHFFIMTAIAPGLATVNIDAENGLNESVENTTSIALQFKTRVGMGYNSDRVFAGLSGIWDYSQFEYGNSTGNIGFTAGSIRVYLGMRFLN